MTSAAETINGERWGWVLSRAHVAAPMSLPIVAHQDVWDPAANGQQRLG